MLSEDFALAGTTKMPWEQWYNEEIVNNEMYKTLFFKYKDTMYQFEPINSEDKGKILNGKLMTEESYMFFKIGGTFPNNCVFFEPTYYATFKDAIDNAKLDDGKTFKEIWDDTESEYLDFL